MANQSMLESKVFVFRTVTINIIYSTTLLPLLLFTVSVAGAWYFSWSFTTILLTRGLTTGDTDGQLVKRNVARRGLEFSRKLAAA